MRCHDRNRLLPILIALGLSACRVGPEHVPPDAAPLVEAGWRQAIATDGPLTADGQELDRWWQSFGSDDLDALAERLLEQNLSLREAAERAIQARARAGIAGATRLPQLDGTAGYFRAGTGAESLNFQGPPPGRELSLFTAGLSAAWELDLWGRVARSVESAEAGVDIAVEDQRAAAVALLAELAAAYVDAHTLRERLAVTERSIAIQQQTEQLALVRWNAGSGTELDARQAERQLAETRAVRPELERALRATENRIAVLVGSRPADDLVPTTDALTLPPSIGVGVPADLLARRADVRRAERRLAQAVAAVGIAEADRYPRITLLGSVALQSSEFDSLFTGRDALAWSLGPSLTVPLFTGDRLDQQVLLRESQVREAHLAFERTLLEAIAEVESAAEGVVRTRERVTELERAVAAAERSSSLARALYTAGSQSLLQALDAERAELAVTDALLAARQAALARTVDLYRALGGGFAPRPASTDDTDSHGAFR